MTLSVACRQNNSDDVTVTVSIPPQKYILEQIAADKINVNCLMSNGSNPETYDPTVIQLKKLENSTAYFRIGNLSFEDAILDKLQSTNPSLPIYNTSEGVSLITGTHHHHCHDDGEECRHEESSVDPHTWTSLKNDRQIATNMLNAIIEIDPQNADFYTARYNSFVNKIDSLDAWAANKLTAHQGDAFLVWHPSLSYLARDYGLQQIVLGDIDGKEVSVNHLKSTIDKATGHNVKVFFFQKNMDNRQILTINNELGTKLVLIDPLEYNCENVVKEIVNALTAEQQYGD